MKNTFDIEFINNKNYEFADYYVEKDTENPIRFLNNFNEINVLVGANNSGKSRFIRGLMNVQGLKGLNETVSFFQLLDVFNDKIKDFNYRIRVTAGGINRLETAFKKNEIDKLQFNPNLEFSLCQIDINESLDEIIKNVGINDNLIKKMDVLQKYYNEQNRFRDNIYNFFLSIHINGVTGENRNFYRGHTELNKIKIIIVELLKLSNDFKEFTGKRIYIPTLRTAHTLFQFKPDENDPSNKKSIKIKQDIYLDTVRKNFKLLNENIEIFTGLSLYNEIVNVRNSIKEERIKFHNFETFLSVNFFEGSEVDIVAKFNIENSDKGIEDDDLIQIYIGGKTRKLHNLGDGIQSLVILMYKIFLADDRSMIFIDEPELNLHPGYQRLFLEQITSNENLIKKNLTYVIVTHSNHFLDLTLEKDNVSIYSFNSIRINNEQKFIIKNVNAGDNQLLRDLGVNNSSVFLANCSIWVEGVSDRNLIKAFLYSYCISKEKSLPQEDIDFAFFEYAGSNLTHYDFNKTKADTNEAIDLITSFALNNKILLISDFDSGKETKHKNIKEIAEETNGFDYHTTHPYREIENLLDNSIWEKILINFCNQNKVTENGHNIQLRIKQSLSQIKIFDYKNEYIGCFLKDLRISELNKIYQIDNNEKPGTFIPKTELSQLILAKVRADEITWNDFSKNSTIVNLTKVIYDFIEKSKV